VESVALAYSGSLENFNANVLRLTLRVLPSRHDAARTDALKAITGSIGQYSSEEMRKAGFGTEIDKFTLGNYRTLGIEDRALISKIYGGVFDKDSSVKLPALETLNRQVRWLNDDRPLWSAVLEKDVVEKIVRDDKIADRPAKFAFVTGVIKQSGTTFNTVPISRLAVDKAHEMLLTPPKAELQREWQGQFLDAGRSSKYPAIRLQVERLGGGR
jgi:hypothetical protein